MTPGWSRPRAWNVSTLRQGFPRLLRLLARLVEQICKFVWKVK